MRVVDFISMARQRLRVAGVYNPEADVDRFILATHGGVRPAGQKELDAATLHTLDDMTRRRAQREPLTRIIGRTVFGGLPIDVAEGVFQPYPETEAIIEHAVAAFDGRHPPTRILDLGTGTGCILLALLHTFPAASGLGIDCEARAVALASENALLCGLETRAAFRVGDWSASVDERFPLIVSNPPRVPSGDIAKLLPEMRDHDPRIAYDGGQDGLTFFRRIAADFNRIATPDAIGVFQISDAAAVAALFRRAEHNRVQIGTNYIGMPNAVIVSLGPSAG